MENTGLIACPTCQHEIGTQADSCPKCGSPNNWSHPRIQALYDQSNEIKLARAARFWHKGAEVWGESASHHFVVWVFAGLVVLASLFSYLLAGFLGPVIGGVFLALVWRVSARKDTFRANLITGKWESTNDELWAPVAALLMRAGQ